MRARKNENGGTVPPFTDAGRFPAMQARRKQMMNEYLVVIETEGDGYVTREPIEYNALSSSEAQAYAFDDLEDNQRVVSVWQRVL
jgi:hypothetical protein